MANEHKVILSADTRSHRTEFNKSVEANKKFTLSIQNVSDQTKLFAAKTRTYSNMAGKAIAGFATVSIAAYAAIYKKQAEFIDQQAKTADRLGISTEALIGLQHAANQTGASTESLNMGLQRMTRRIGQVAATGSGEAAVALEQLGISIDEIKDKSPDQQFALIAEKMKGIHEQGQKVFLTQKLFDSEGVKLLNTLNLGADGIAAMITEAEELGITFSRIDASKVEMANDSFDRAEKLLSSFGTKLATETAPLVGALSDLFVETAKEAGGFGKLAQQVIGKVSTGIGVMADGVHGLKVLFNGAKVVAMGFSTALWQGLAFVINKGIVPFANRVTNGILFPLRKVLELAQHIPGVGDSAKKALAELNKLGNAEGFKTLDEIGETAFDSLIQAKEDLHNSMMEPLPSERIKGWIEDVQAKFQAAAAEQTSKGGKTGLSNLISSDQKALVDAAKKQYEKIHEAQLAMEGKEIELENRRFERQQQQMEKEFQLLRDKNLLTAEIEASYKLAKEQAEAQHQQNITNIQKEQQEAREKKEKEHKEKLDKEEKTRMDTMQQSYDSLFNVMSGYFDGMDSKKASYAKSAMSIGAAMLDDEKSNSIQSIWTNTYDTAMKAYNALADIPYVGPVLGAAAAGVVIAAGGMYAGKVSGLASFDGGGYTGNLPRYGGVDGKGGFHAILHGNETVVDHSKGQSLGANVTVNLFEDASRAGSTTRSSGPSGEEVINIFVTSIRQGGEASSVLENTYGLQRQGF
ncbi:hypothetical protein [Pseudoalteromonas arabiensis]|uniref:hypothetical protein n=2 Tax=Pseudoalteromonas TaxID=53246 RepID=UPI000780AFA4|nr:hypothetical protein [Pseudoalteromonas arabiensis]